MNVHVHTPAPAPALAPTFQAIMPGDSTPWGMAETVSYITDGITYVSTERHGGFHVDPRLLYRVPLRWRLSRHGANACEDSCWFEEDCDWTMVVLTFPRAFCVKSRSQARDVFKACVEGKASRVKL